MAGSQVCDSGFFKYTRHPNYFGDFVIWVAHFILAVGSDWPYGLLVAGSPLLMFVMLRFVSGVAMLDKVQAATKPKYRGYINSTSAFFPVPATKPHELERASEADSLQ